MFKNVDWFDFIVGGIIISFIVNLVSNFAYPKIQKWWNDRVEIRRSKNESKRIEFNEKVERLLKKRDEELITRIQVNRYTTFSSFNILFSIFIMILTSLISFQNIIIIFSGVIVGVFFFYQAMSSFSKRNELVEILDEIDKKLERNYL